MKNKVAIVVCAWPPQGGGIGNNAYYHLKELKNLGYTVKAFTPKYNKEENKDGVAFLHPVLPIGKAGFLFGLFKRLRDFDIVHFYYPFFGTDFIIMFFKFFNRNKKLVTHYEMDPIGTGWQKIFFFIHIKLFLGPLVRLSDKVGVLSWDNARGSYLKKYLDKYKDKFVELPNGVDTENFKPQEKRKLLADNYGISKNDKVIVFVGGLDDQHFFKGVDILLEAFSRLKDEFNNIKLMIIGDGNRKEDYKKIAKELNLNDRVIFTGWIKNELLPDYYNLSDLFVLPSTEKTESFGIVTAEAQACGVPAIVSNWPGSRETMEDGETGLLVEPRSVEDLILKLRKILGDDGLREEMSKKARQRAVEKYSWDNVIKKIDNLYNETK